MDILETFEIVHADAPTPAYVCTCPHCGTSLPKARSALCAMICLHRLPTVRFRLKRLTCKRLRIRHNFGIRRWKNSRADDRPMFDTWLAGTCASEDRSNGRLVIACKNAYAWSGWITGCATIERTVAYLHGDRWTLPSPSPLRKGIPSSRRLWR